MKITSHNMVGLVKAAAAIKQASKVKSNPNDPDDLATLVKKQESFEKVLAAYKKNPSKESLQKVITHLKATAAKHPHHLNPGYYGAVFDTIDRAKEMMGRGNTLRGLATYGLAVPLESAWATLTAPETALARAMNKDRNVDSTSLEALSAADPSNIKRNARAATELHDAYVSTREDPTKQVENLMNEARRMVYTPGKGGWLAGARLPITLAVDALSAPHTALFNSKGWNGKSRKEWEAEQEKSAAYDALMEKRAMREQTKYGLIGAGLGGLLGAGTGYLTGEDADESKKKKSTRLRNALVGALIGAGGGAGLGAWAGDAKDYLEKRKVIDAARRLVPDDEDARYYGEDHAKTDGGILDTPVSVGDVLDRMGKDIAYPFTPSWKPNGPARKHTASWDDLHSFLLQHNLVDPKKLIEFTSRGTPLPTDSSVMKRPFPHIDYTLTGRW